MKKLAFAIIISIMLVASTSFAFTYDGDIDPHKFLDWKVVGVLEINEYMGTMWLENPKMFSRIKYATVHLIGGGLSWYTYWKRGTLYTFEYNRITDRFELTFVLKVE